MVMTVSNSHPVPEMEAALSADRPFSGFDGAEVVQPGSDRRIRFSFLATWLGTTLVAEIEDEVCAVLVGDDESVLEADLAGRFRGFELVREGEASPLALHVAQHIDAIDESPNDVPLAMHGTEFQRSVWTALQEIPKGETTTYAALAGRIGKPGSVRAVARACGANPVAVLVPCHRVLRSDGGISGYRWGVERKLALLERERPADVGLRL